MSDTVISQMQHINQPPLSWYFEPDVLVKEQTILFDRAPKYVGHELLVPNLGDYHVVQSAQQSKVLVKNENGIELLSNICRHRQAIILTGRGNTKNICCPLHSWTYNLHGELLGAPLFKEKPCLNLLKTPLQNWKGLLFEGERHIADDLAGMPEFNEIDFSGFMLDRVEVDEYAFNWKTFIEVYQEDYHVAPFHPGLGRFVDCDKLSWTFGEQFSVQTVGINNHLENSGTPVYERWSVQVKKYNRGKLPELGAIWLTYYPNIMVEWYPNTLVISTVVPRGVDACTNIVEFYYPEEIVLFEREFIEAEKAAYRETADEDDEICSRMQQGRRALYLQGVQDFGPYQSPSEDGLRHFHQYLIRNLREYFPF